MAYSTQSAVSDGTLSVLPLSIDYLSRDDITVYLGSTQAPAGAWAWVGTIDRSIKFTTVVPKDVVVTIKRSTGVTGLYHKFSGGAQFTSKTLDESLTQTLFVAQEFSESSSVASDDLPLPVGAQASAGKSNKYARTDHVHVGMTGGSVGSVVMDTFTGDGVKLAFVLANTPATKGSTQVYVDNVYQSKATYALAGPTITFDEAPAIGANIEVITVTIGGGKASDVLVNETPQMLATDTGGNVQGALQWIASFVQAGAGAVVRTIRDKLRERVSVADFGSGIGKGDAAKDTAAFLAALAALRTDYYNKGSMRLHVPVPEQPYRINQTLDLTEMWNLTIDFGNAWGFQRQQVLDPLTDNAMIHWYGAAGGTVFRVHYAFGLRLENLSINGRGLAKVGIAVAPSVSGPSVTRKVDIVGAVIKNCDFGIVVGDLTAATDNAPVNILQPHISGCTSAGVVVNSGNAAVHIMQPFFINNGYAPTTGNSFISDGVNGGCHLNMVAGLTGVTDWTSDHDTDHLIGKAAILQYSGSLRVNGAWCDDPTKPFYKGVNGGDYRAVHMSGVTHYDSGMTLASTPNSIEYEANQPLVMNGCFLYGNVSITSGVQASVIDNGTRFYRAGAGFTGDMVLTYGGLSRTASTGANSVASSIGGDFPKDLGVYHALTVWSQAAATGLVRATRGATSYKVTESVLNGQMFVAGNAYLDGDTGQWKAIKPGPAWRHAFSGGTELMDSCVATTAGQVLTWVSAHGFQPGTGPNAMPKLLLGGPSVSWEATQPADGTGAQDSIVFKLGTVPGGIVGWICTGSGRVWKSFGTIAA